MSDVPVPLRILQALADETLNRLALASEIEHPGESGRAREQILTAFIEQLVPSSFSVSTGFVVDALGGKSRQVDVVVYRTDYAPVFEIGRVKHFLVESVVAVLEVKAAIDSEADLKQALDNIASVKALDRTNRGRNTILAERIDTRKPVKRDDDLSHIFGAIVTEKSLAKDFPKDFHAWLEAHMDRRWEWPNLYVDARQFVAWYRYTRSPDRYQPPVRAIGSEAMLADELAVSRPDNPNAVPPLVVLGVELLGWFRVVPLIDFIPADYLPLPPRAHDVWPLTAASSADAGGTPQGQP